jgi:elongator complex protein 2
MDGDKQAIYLVSSGQDRNIRIWKIGPKFHGMGIGPNEGTADQCFSIKMYIEGPTFKVGSSLWQASLESILIGHDDWVYSIQWKPSHVEWIENAAGMQAKIVQPMSILSASMDRTMMIWKPDVTTGLWVNEVTVGELGHTALGFYGGIWSPSGDAILAHAFGGSFHLWKNVGEQVSNWQPQLVPSGHSSSVSDVAWAKNGQFLLSTSHDQVSLNHFCMLVLVIKSSC